MGGNTLDIFPYQSCWSHGKIRISCVGHVKNSVSGRVGHVKITYSLIPEEVGHDGPLTN